MAHGTLLNIRPANYRERFHQAFAAIGWLIVDSPVLVPETMSAALPSAQDFDAVIFTSQMAVEALGAASAWREKTAYAVGPATAEAARRAGFTHTVQTGLDSGDLAAFLAAADFRRAFYPSAEEVSADISLGDPIRIRRLPVYRMAPATALSPDALNVLRARQPVLAPLFSRRSAQTLAGLLQKAGINAENSTLAAVAISADVLGPAAGPWQRWAVADKPTLEAVVAKTAATAMDMTSEATS